MCVCLSLSLFVCSVCSSYCQCVFNGYAEFDHAWRLILSSGSMLAYGFHCGITIPRSPSRRGKKKKKGLIWICFILARNECCYFGKTTAVMQETRLPRDTLLSVSDHMENMEFLCGGFKMSSHRESKKQMAEKAYWSIHTLFRVDQRHLKCWPSVGQLTMNMISNEILNRATYQIMRGWSHLCKPYYPRSLFWFSLSLIGLDMLYRIQCWLDPSAR